MATDKDIKSSVVASSKEIFDTNCSPCSESGKLIEAVKFCVDCGSYFCSKCLEYHNKFPSLRSHQILDKSDKIKSDGNIETGPGLPTERCAVHHGKLVDMFCKDHDEVCCAACIAIKHRSCINVDYLPDVAQGINNSTEYEKTKSSLENVLVELRGVIEAKTENLKILQEDKEQLFEEIENLKTVILVKVEELVETSKQQVSLKYGEVKKHIQSDLDTLNTILTTTTDLQKLSEKNESQLFVNLRASKVSIRVCEKKLNELSTSKVNEKLGLVANNSLKDKLNDIESLVSDVKIESSVDVIGVKEYKATLSGKYKIDPNNCEVTGICVMDDGSFIIADYTHSKLKRLNEELMVTDFVEVGGHPYSVCRVGQNEVATYIYIKGEIQLFSLGKTMQLASTINISELFDNPVGVCYDTTLDAFMLCDNDEISVYNKSGNLIKTLEKDKNGDQLFREPRHVAMSTNNQIMVVSDEGGNNVTALTRDGEIVWTFSDPSLHRPLGVCILPGDIILVSGLSSNNVLQVNKKGEMISELLGASEKLNQPMALAFEKRTSRLVVGSSSNELRVYTLS